MPLPAEWATQQMVIFALPNRQSDWGEHRDAAAKAIIHASNLVSQATPTLLLVGDPDYYAAIGGNHRGRHLRVATNDVWVRDYGPLTIRNSAGELTMLDFRFNGWGGKYPADLDDSATAQVHAAEFTDLGIQQLPLELEGGAVESNGAGTILTTTSCLLNPNRNGGGMDRAGMERQLQTHLGADKILWLENGHLIGDDTDGHIDTLARFVDERIIAYVRCDDSDDPHYPALSRMETELREYAKNGEDFRLLPLPWCPPVYSSDDGRRLPATYANFLISNGRLYLPTYFDRSENALGHKADRAALRALATGTSYRVIPVPCRPIIEQHGSLHCLTMQVPR